MSIAVILGSAYGQESAPEGVHFEAEKMATPFGEVVLHRVHGVRDDKEVYAIFRHGRPHDTLPNQVNYRGHTFALREKNCDALLVTSSVGVMSAEVEIYQPLLVRDLLMPQNTLPDGSACTMFVSKSKEQGHLVLNEGLFSQAIDEQLKTLANDFGRPLKEGVIFAYVGGPRTKTKAENRFWASLGAQVNSMTLGPEVVLANEYEIPTSALVVGHKYSIPDRPNPEDHQTLAGTLVSSREAMNKMIYAWLKSADAVPYKNQIFRF